MLKQRKIREEVRKEEKKLKEEGKEVKQKGFEQIIENEKWLWNEKKGNQYKKRIIFDVNEKRKEKKRGRNEE